MFAPSIAFVDLETTGTTARDDRITEVGIVCVDAEGNVTEWSTLVDPQCSIPAEIQALTGITNAMVDGAPTFAQVAADIETRIAGRVFVAHNARFDYGFLKHEFGRLGRTFTAKVLCTVKLSRRLYPDAARHNLDTIIDRHCLAGDDRHRALGDARILWQFVQAIYRDRSADEVDIAVRRILKSPSLPSHLPADALDGIPEAPGVYRFYGLNAHPLYIGKSINLRERVASHFSADYRGVSDLRLSAEIQRIEVEETAGELGALLRESQLIKALLPAYNFRLRKRDAMVALKVGSQPGPPEFVTSSAIDPRSLEHLYGPFVSRSSARETLRHLASDAALCWCALGLERRAGACFARQVKKCAGVCVGAESKDAHHARFRRALLPHALRPWPYAGTVAVREVSLTGDRTDVHLFSHWCWLGTANDDDALHALIDCVPCLAFDLDLYRLLTKQLPKHHVRLMQAMTGM